MSLCILRGASLIYERIAGTKLSPMRLIHLHRKPLFESFSSLRSTPATSIVDHVTTGPVKAAPVSYTLHKLLHYSSMASSCCCNSPIFGAYTNSDQTLKKTGGNGFIRNMSTDAYDVPADKKINSEAFADLLKNQDIRLIIDARGRSEVEQTGLLPKSVNIPAGEYATVMKMPDAKFKYKYGFDKPQKHEVLVFVCSTGVRSSKALKTALDMGYKSFSTSTRSNESQQPPEAHVKIGPERHLDYKALVKLMERKDVVLIDVREPHELKETGELPGSINIPLNELKVALQELNDAEFQKKYGAKKPGLNAPLVFSCRSGARSLKALQLALELGYMKAKHYRGGFLDWVKNVKLKTK